MGRLKELQLQRQEARPFAFKLLLETGYDLEAALGLCRKRVQDGSLLVDGNVLRAVLSEVHAEGEPLKGVRVVVAEKSRKDVA